MKLKNKVLMMSLAALTAFSGTAAQALSIDWKGTYRFEWTEIDRPSLATPYGRKSYGLNYLSLDPKIIAADGVNIVSRFDVLANQDATYADAQFGQLFGQGWNTGAAYQSNVHAQNQRATSLNVAQLYLNVNQEYGALVLGRAPIDFGLGITHNAGDGAFDHWSGSEDLVGYKFIIDNFFVMPILGRVADHIYQGNTVQDMIFHVQYESKESGSLIGLMHQTRKAAAGANDTPINSVAIPGATAKSGEYNIQTISFILGREWESFNFKLEAGVNSGGMGVTNAAGSEIKSNGYGLAAELNFPRKASKTEWSLRLGMATGDDPTTTDAYEAYQFNRNYDVALLMFNHRLGQFDYLTSSLIRDTTKGVSDSLDDEAISNVMYVAPKMSYAWNDRLDLNNTVIYGQLMTNPTTRSDFNKSLGLEWDIELAYRPTDRIQWINQIGILFPGKAFKYNNSTADLEAATTYGFASKAAISF